MVNAFSRIRLIGVALAISFCAACLEVAVSMRDHPGGLAEAATMIQVVVASWIGLFVLSALLLSGAQVLVPFLLRWQWSVGALRFGIGLWITAWAVVTTVWEVGRFDIGVGSIFRSLGVALVLAWVVVPLPWLVARVDLLLPTSFSLRRITRHLHLLCCTACALICLLAWQYVYPARVVPQVVGRVARTRVQHVVLLTVDTLRPDFLSIYNPDAPSTPRLQELARDSLVFENAVSPAPWTKPSLASLMTGLAPSTHGVLRHGDSLADAFETLAERFVAAGYHTGLIGFNPFFKTKGNFEQGFVDYYAFPRGGLGSSLGAKLAARLSFSVRRDPGTTPAMTDFAIEWLQGNQQRPFFFWLHLYDPHQPYKPPPEYMPEGEPPSAHLRHFKKFRPVRSGHLKLNGAERDWIRALYAGEVRQVDHHVGRVLDELKRLGIYEDALIVFASDHGEEFWEHGGFEHGHALYEELLRVPLLVKLPRVTQSRRVKERVSLEAVYPTMLAVAGLSASDSLVRRSSLMDVEDDRDISFAAQGLLYYEEKVALTRNGKKYIRSLVTQEEELYDLVEDPGERNSRADAAPVLLRAMREESLRLGRSSSAARHQLGLSDEIELEDLDDATLRQLKSLGYIH